ncbi:MAG: sigma factor-like helix-turn-helix DNA-binding protein [Ilumatobacteraceae bacterium]
MAATAPPPEESPACWPRSTARAPDPEAPLRPRCAASPRTLEEVGGLTSTSLRERIRQIEARAMSKLRHLERHRLRDLLAV